MDIQDLFPDILMACKNCPEPDMTRALLRAGRMLCVESWILRRTLNITCSTTSQQVLLPAVPGEQIFAIKAGALTQLPPPQASVVPLTIGYSEYFNPNNGVGQPCQICFVPYQSVAFDRIPDQAYPVLVEVCTQPLPEGQTMPDELGVKYDRALGYGALEWLYRQKGSSWYSPPEAERYYQLFSQEVVRARADAAFDFTPGTRAWVRNPFMRRRWWSSWG